MTQETPTTALSGLVGQGMIWSKPTPGWRSGPYELRLGEERLATLKFRRLWGTFATGETAEGRWTFKRVGFFQNRVTVRAESSEAEAGVFVNNWKMGGTLELPDGRRYLGNTNFWMTQFGFTNAAGQPLVSYRRIGGMTSLSAAVEIEPAGAELRELPWLVLLGWYVAVMLHQDSSMVAAGGGGGGGGG
jgi:hypothetical protein